MHITELDSFKLSDAVKFHNRLNPKIWGRDEHLLPEVREKLMAIADNFREFLGVGDLDVRDVTISGSNAAYNYTPYSDIDLHLVVEFPENNEIYQELFNAKKYQYNDEHKLSIGGVPVELYVQNAAEPPVSQGEYSISRDEWIQVPRRKRARIDDTCVRAKVEDLDARIHSAIQSGNAEHMSRLWDKIKSMRQSGLDQHGEFGCENIVFKILRNKGCIKDLRTARTAAQDRELSLKEHNRPQTRKIWGFGEGHQGQPYSSPDGVAPSTQMFLNESDIDSVLSRFFKNCIDFLEIENAPKMVLHHDTDWSEKTGSFGQYDPDDNVLHLATSGRHILDILRTMAHEVTHCKQNENHTLPPNAGETGSWWEDEANAMAGRIMRYFADEHPEMFKDVSLEQRAPDMNQSMQESSGYIPTKAQANDPRFEMALSVDVHPGQTGREANKMSLATDAQGHPQLLRADGKVKLAESLAREFELFEEQDLFEINMGSKNLRREAAKTGAIAGMEFEMIVPGMESEDPEMEPDYDQDERCRSIDDAVNFFHDGDYNGRRDVERLRERMQDDFQEWRDEKLRDDWGGESQDYIRDWIRNNVKDDEWNPNELTGDERNEAFDEFAANVDADPSSTYYNEAFDEYREEFQDNWDESDWLDATDLDRMSEVEQMYGMNWPYWTNMQSGEIDADQVADEFSQAVGREVRVNTRYHQSGDRPGPNNQFYVVEPDASLEGDNDGDEGLEFVSPPMPIDELLKDLNAVKAWAGRMGVYTNSSTGLHINISVPNYSIDRLDYVKLALLLGDEYVLNQFGRASNTYTKSALGKVRDRVRSNPEDAKQLLDKMKGQMGDLASKAIHSGSTDKYTSINTKSGHIEFRSPGGDWLDDNFDKIENTLLRFTVAMSAALNPEAYREEYQKKLYKLLNPEGIKDEYGDMIQEFANYMTALQGDSKEVVGKLSKETQQAVKDFRKVSTQELKQKNLASKLKKSNSSGQRYWWRVSNPGNSYASVEVVATSKEEAIEKALGDDGYPSWANTRQSIVAEPVRPYEENPAQQTQHPPRDTSQFGSARGAPNWEIRRDSDQEVVYRFSADNQNDAVLQAIDFMNTQGWSDDDYTIQKVDSQTDVNPLRPTGPGPWEVANRQNNQVYYNTGHGIRSAAEAEARTWLSQNGHNPNDFEVRTREGSRSDSAQSGIIDIEPDIEVVYPGSTAALAQQRAIPGTFSGAWKVLVNGEEVHRFSGIGNNQGDANRVAAQWLRNNGQGVSGEGFEVVPIMTEGLAEGKDRYGNFDPPGPETPPTMPAGTVRVDVSDVYDWYKLGQHISNMKGLGKHDFGKGPPSAIISFGDEDLEHQYIQALKQTGLTTTDIDPVDPNQPAGMPRQKTDPTYNVNEADASDYELHDRPKLDQVLAKCCRMVVQGQQRDPKRYGQVAACVIDPDNRMIYGINLPGKDGTRRHAERVAIDKYRKSIGEIPQGSIVVTTCSPCNSPMEERHGESCKDLLNSVGIHKVYAGYQDPTQHDDSDADFRVYVTENDQLWGECQLFAQTFLGVEELAENFQEPVNEILKITPFQMSRSSIDTHDQGIKSAKKLPGGSGLLYKINNENFRVTISIYDPQKQGKNPVGRQIGILTLSPGGWYLPIESSLRVNMIAVDPQYRAQGIAKAMYGLVLTKMKRTLVAGDSQSPGGRKNWLSLAQIPGVSVKGYVAIDNRLLDSRIDTIMGKLGGEYIGSDLSNRKFFAFDVLPGTNELKPAVVTSLNKIYSGALPTGLYATWSGTVNEQGVAVL